MNKNKYNILAKLVTCAKIEGHHLYCNGNKDVVPYLRKTCQHIKNISDQKCTFNLKCFEYFNLSFYQYQDYIQVSLFFSFLPLL